MILYVYLLPLFVRGPPLKIETRRLAELRPLHFIKRREFQPNLLLAEPRDLLTFGNVLSGKKNDDFHTTFHTRFGANMRPESRPRMNFGGSV